MDFRMPNQNILKGLDREKPLLPAAGQIINCSIGNWELLEWMGVWCWRFSQDKSHSICEFPVTILALKTPPAEDTDKMKLTHSSFLQLLLNNLQECEYFWRIFRHNAGEWTSSCQINCFHQDKIRPTRRPSSNDWPFFGISCRFAGIAQSPAFGICYSRWNPSECGWPFHSGKHMLKAEDAFVDGCNCNDCVGN